MILFYPLSSVANKAHRARLQISKPVKIVLNRVSFWVSIKRIDREVAPSGILAPIAGKCYGRAPPVGADIMAQRRDLNRPIAKHGSDGAVVDTRWHDFDPCIFTKAHRLLGQMRCRAVHIMDIQPQQSVADAAANPADASRAQCSGELRQPFALHPAGLGKHAHESLLAKLAIIPAVTPQIRKPS